MPVQEMRSRVSSEEWRMWNVWWARAQQGNSMQED